MFLSWVSVSFLALMCLSILGAWLSGDRRIRIGVLTLALVWVTSMMMRFALGFTFVVAVDLLCNIVVAYVFWQLHLGDEGDESGPNWPVVIILFEVAIFLSHVTSFTFGLLHYVYIINILFAAELFFIIGLCALRVLRGKPDIGRGGRVQIDRDS